MHKHLPRAVALVLFIIGTTSLHAQTTAFEAATVRPCPPNADPNLGSWSRPGSDRFVATHLTLERLLMLAYGVDASQLANKPSWLATNLYDVNAKSEDGTKLTVEDTRTCLQSLLQERFHLQAHTEVRAQSGYALLVAKGGPHLIPTKGDHFPGFRINVSPGYLQGYNWTMPYLARMLTGSTGFPVVDRTNITGSYDIDVTYEPESKSTQDTPTTSLPPLTAAVRQTLGLELKPQKVPVNTVVIDNLFAAPTDN
jgi:uncharacterized protein (TIGR03435 family)